MKDGQEERLRKQHERERRGRQIERQIENLLKFHAKIQMLVFLKEKQCS